MAAAFRQTDVRRIQTIFDGAIDAPYEATVALGRFGDMMTVRITDPDEPDFCVWQCRFDFDASLAAKIKQPSDEEARRIAFSAAAVCARYPEQKAAEAKANAERAAIAETILEEKARQDNARAAAEARALLEQSKAEVPDDVIMNGVREAIAAGIANRG